MDVDILLVDDEPAIRQMLSFALTNEGYACTEAADAAQAQAAIARARPDLVLLDWMMPGVSGLDLARRLKRDPKTRAIPIIMLTARDDEPEKVKGLDVGADDYITKPFSTAELLARIRAVLRRGKDATSNQRLEVAGLSLNADTHRVSVKGELIELSPTEFRLLHFFIANPERVHSRGQLLDQVWGDDSYIEERTVDVHIRRLRKILTPHGFDRFIQTVRNVGYRFSTEENLPG